MACDKAPRPGTMTQSLFSSKISICLSNSITSAKLMFFIRKRKYKYDKKDKKRTGAQSMTRPACPSTKRQETHFETNLQHIHYNVSNRKVTSNISKQGKHTAIYRRSQYKMRLFTPRNATFRIAKDRVLHQYPPQTQATKTVFSWHKDGIRHRQIPSKNC